MTKSKREIRNISMLSNVIISFAAMLVIATILSAVVATLISGEQIGYDALNYVAPITSLVVVFIGCLLSGNMIEEKKALCCGVTATAYFAFITGVGMLFFDGVGSGFIFGLIACCVGCIAAILLCTQDKRRNKHKISKKTRK